MTDEKKILVEVSQTEIDLALECGMTPETYAFHKYLSIRRQEEEAIRIANERKIDAEWRFGVSIFDEEIEFMSKNDISIEVFAMVKSFEIRRDDFVEPYIPGERTLSFMHQRERRRRHEAMLRKARAAKKKAAKEKSKN